MKHFKMIVSFYYFSYGGVCVCVCVCVCFIMFALGGFSVVFGFVLLEWFFFRGVGGLKCSLEGFMGALFFICIIFSLVNSRHEFIFGHSM